MSAGIRDHVPALAEGRVLDETTELGIDFYNDLGALTAGTLVYVSGWHTASDLPKVSKADADVAGKAATYVVNEAVADTTIGVLRRKTRPIYTSLDTSLSAVGNAVYASDTAGGIGLAAVGSGQVVGRVVTLHATRSKIAFDLEGPGTNGGAGGSKFFDSVFEIMDEADDTKKAVFDVGTYVVGTRTFKFPNASGTLALLDLAQSWTQAQTFGADDTGVDVKMFGATAGVYVLWDESADTMIFTDGAKMSFGAGADLVVTPDGTNVVFSGAGAALWHDTSLLIVDPADTTKRARFDAGSVTAGQTRIVTLADMDVGLSGPCYVSTAASTAITGATEVKTAFDTKKTIAANVLKAGTTLHIIAWGNHSATSGAETHDIALELGAVVVTSDAAVDPANGDIFSYEAWLTVRTVGAGGTIVGYGRKRIGAVGTAEVPFVLTETAINTTIANDVAVYMTRQGAATDGDSAALQQIIVEISG